MDGNAQTRALSLECLFEMTLHIVPEGEVIPDVELERTRRRVLRIRQPVWLDLVRLAHRELCGALEVGDGPVGLPNGQVTMATVPIESRVVGVHREGV